MENLKKLKTYIEGKRGKPLSDTEFLHMLAYDEDVWIQVRNMIREASTMSFFEKIKDDFSIDLTERLSEDELKQINQYNPFYYEDTFWDVTDLMTELAQVMIEDRKSLLDKLAKQLSFTDS